PRAPLLLHPPHRRHPPAPAPGGAQRRPAGVAGRDWARPLELDARRPDDWPAVRAIYEAGIATGNATFETAAPDWPAWDAAHLADHRLGGQVGGPVAEWTAPAPAAGRPATTPTWRTTGWWPRSAAGSSAGPPWPRCRSAVPMPGWPRTASTWP